jgi:hypothetical protein
MFEGSPSIRGLDESPVAAQAVPPFSEVPRNPNLVVRPSLVVVLFSEVPDEESLAVRLPLEPTPYWMKFLYRGWQWRLCNLESGKWRIF